MEQLVAAVDISIAGKHITLQCDDGQEARLKELAARFSERIKPFQQQAGSDLAFVMAALSLEDALEDATIKAQKIPIQPIGQQPPQQNDAQLDILATEIEQLAMQLESRYNNASGKVLVDA